MRAVQVVVVTIGVDQLAGVVQVEELVFVEAFVAELAVEALDVAVLGGFSWGDEAMVDGVLVRPALQRQARELGSVVGDQARRFAAQRDDEVEHTRDPRAGQRGVGLDPQALAGVVILHGEQAQRTTADHAVMHEVEAPSLVGALRRGRRRTAAHDALLAPPTLTHLQALLAIQPVNPLVVVRDAVAAQEHKQTPIAPASPHLGMSPQRGAHWRLIASAVGLVVVAAHGQVQQPAHSRHADGICLGEVIGRSAASGGLYQSFEFTSLSIRMSRAWSATIFFSSLFSRSSWRSRDSWLGSSPP